jgi:hypothetical protein
VTRLLRCAVLAAATLAPAACGGESTGGSGGGAPAVPCAARFVGDYADLQMYGSECASLESEGKDFTLAISVSSPKIDTQTVIKIDLGDQPETGPSSSATLPRWSAISADSAGCVYEAGNQVVPPGSFTLTLTALDPSSGVVHGTLEVLQSVHAPPMKDCGKTNYEQIDVQF